jgi:hypothetical protein
MTNKRTNNDAQNSTQKSKDRATRSALSTGVDIWCSGRVSNLSSTCDTNGVTLVGIQVKTRVLGKDWIVITKNGTCEHVVICDTDIPQRLTRSG